MGKKSIYAEECRKGDYIGVDFSIQMDLSSKLPDEWRVFNKEFIPIYLQKEPGKSKIAAGLSCAFVHTVCKGIQLGDIVLCPDGSSRYYVGEVKGNYYYRPNANLPHQRKVVWLEQTINRSDMSEPLQNSSGSIGTVSNISQYAEEIEKLIGTSTGPVITTKDPTIENPSEFAMEKHLEEFLVTNWKQSELGVLYDIYEEDGEVAGKQYPSDTGPIDILAISKDKHH